MTGRPRCVVQGEAKVSRLVTGGAVLIRSHLTVHFIPRGNGVTVPDDQ